jgi:hypothetical protein
MFETSDAGIRKAEIQVSHPDNKYRLGDLIVTQTDDEGITAEIQFQSVSDDMPGEYVMGTMEIDQLRDLYRNLGDMIKAIEEATPEQ